MRYLYGSLYYLMRAVSKDKYLVGSWYGNDTIWRTVLDLYTILMFADKKGNLSPEKQRRIFNIADMIISGEGNGPVAPEPKKLGFIIAGSDPIVMDRVVCEIMGFDYSKIPMLVNAGIDGSVSEKNPENILLLSNSGLFNKKKINELHLPSKWKFKPYESWTGHIEKK